MDRTPIEATPRDRRARPGPARPALTLAAAPQGDRVGLAVAERREAGPDGLVHLRKGETFAQLEAEVEVSTSTAWRYVQEAVALRKAKQDGLHLLVLDTTSPIPRSRPTARTPSFADPANAHLARLDPQVGLRLAALPCDLVWATTWEEAANALIAPRLGLPRLPVVTWPEPSDEEKREDQWFGLCWKTRTVVAWADQRPFAWVDDEITEADRDWVSAHHPGRARVCVAGSR